MKLGIILSFVIYLLLLFMVFLINYLASMISGMREIALSLSIVMISVAGFLLFWAFTLEGNTYIARTFGGKNLAISILNEPGNFGKFSQISANSDDYERDGKPYKIKNEALIVRRSMGTPYIIHKSGIADPFLVWQETKGIDAAENSAYLNRKVALEIQKKVGSKFDRLQLIMILGFALILGGLILNYFKLGDIVGTMQQGFNMVMAKIPTPTPAPGSIPSV